jgi:O-antigen ligase
MAFAGRQTNIDFDDKEDTFQGRVMLWREGMALFQQSPLFGIGRGMMAEENGTVAHNSYVHAYAELGVFGGTMFVGLIYLSVMGLYRMRWRADAGGFRTDPTVDELRRWRSCLLAVMVGYAVGILALSRTYALPTYLIVGAVAAYCRMSLATGKCEGLPVLNQRLVFRLAGVSVAFLVCFKVLIRVL